MPAHSRKQSHASLSAKQESLSATSLTFSFVLSSSCTNMAVKVLSDPRGSMRSIARQTPPRTNSRTNPISPNTPHSARTAASHTVSAQARSLPAPVCTSFAPSAQTKRDPQYTRSDNVSTRRFSVASSSSVPACARLSSPSDEEDSFTPNAMMPALPCIPTFHSAPVTSSRSQACQNPSSFAAKRPSVCLTDDSNSSDNDSTSSSTYIFKHHNNVPKQSQSATSSQHQNAFLASMSPPKPGVCHFCKSCKTGQWRRGPGGMRTLCNACGINWCRKVRAYARVNGVSVGEAEATVGSDGAWFRRVVA